ncbi:methionine synthase [bacterium]|nr:methionine synthase [bacterium]
MTFFDRLQDNRVILFDGAMGTQIQRLTITEKEWAGKTGCNEILNLTAAEKIQSIHQDYFAAGAEVVETNTLGSNRIVLAEYELADKTVEVNRAAARIARRAADTFTDRPRFVAGSIGPGTRLISLGQTDFASMHRSYLEQAIGLIEGGIDLFLIETCQDVLQIKTCLLALQDAMKQYGVQLPVGVSVTVETTGTLLLGTQIDAVLAILSAFDIHILGMNCATGPEPMRPFIQQICRQFPGRVACQPNAGMPQNIDGQMVYTLAVDEFVSLLSAMVKEEGVGLVGGCCGTTPEFIKGLASALNNVLPASRDSKPPAAIASLFSSQTLRQDPAPFFVGERANTNGSKQFREVLLAEDWDGIVQVAREQAASGAHGLDLCVAYTGRDEKADMAQAVRRLVTQVDLPLFIDSTDVQVIESALQLYGGRAVINSINLEDGEDRVDQVCRLAKRYGAALIGLTIDEQGMALTVERKLEVVQRLYDIAVLRHGLRPQDLIFDALTFTLGSGDSALADAASNTLEAIQRIKAGWPGVYTLLGVSNISFGLSPHSRDILNSVFLAQAVQAGLDLAIVHVKKILPLYQIAEADLDVATNLLFNRGEEPLKSFIRHFEEKNGAAVPVAMDESSLPLEERIRRHIIQGNRSGLPERLQEALRQRKALAIINDLLIPAMKTVGELFGAGKMQLPFVLQSAEVMKFAVDHLQPFMEKSAVQSPLSIVLATVRGDVHDIGKNLVEIILSNNGYKVYNLGIKCEIETMIHHALEVHADAIGMSGLLVKSTVVMKENLEELARRGLQIPVLLGGAALTRRYVEETCAPILDAPVVYCSDAFDGLAAMEKIKEGTLVKKTAAFEPAQPAMRPSLGTVDQPIRRDVEIPKPPFWGDRLVTDIELDAVFSHLTENVLFRGRWGYRRGTLSAAEFEALIAREARPALERIKERCKQEALLRPAVAYGYYPCNSDGDEVIVFHPKSGAEWLRLRFPRQRAAPHRCIADFFLPAQEKRQDLIAVQVVTIGAQAGEEAKRLYEQNAYKDYLLFHGLSVEAAEALAEYWHRKVREELGILEQEGAGIEDFVMQKYRGSRYSFGYPACPNLAENRKLFQLVRPERIGVFITEEDQMVLEQTTSAFIVHHPQAKYFRVE